MWKTVVTFNQTSNGLNYLKPSGNCMIPHCAKSSDCNLQLLDGLKMQEGG